MKGLGEKVANHIWQSTKDLQYVRYTCRSIKWKHTTQLQNGQKIWTDILPKTIQEKLKKYSISLVTREIQIKTTVRYPFHIHWNGKLRAFTRIWEDWSSHVQLLFVHKLLGEIFWQFLYKVKDTLVTWPRCPPLRCVPKRHEGTYLHRPVGECEYS
jgi:hypothetical protein